jgi:hypothetical protein
MQNDIRGDVFRVFYCMTDPEAYLPDPNPEMVQLMVDMWANYWRLALRRARQFNDRERLHAMLDTGHPVPAKIARQLLDLKGPSNRPPAIDYSPVQVAVMVRQAICEGVKFADSFDEVARRLGCKRSAVETYYRACPGDVRQRIKQVLQEEYRLRAIIKNAKTPEQAEDAKAELGKLEWEESWIPF